MGIFWQASAARRGEAQPWRTSAACGRRRAPAGFTLVEMLIAMGLTLIMVVAIAEFYGYVGTTVKDGRAAIEMSAQVSNAAARLKADLDLLTVPVRPAADDGSGHGYFTVKEGPSSDIAPWTSGDPDSNPADGVLDLTVDINPLNGNGIPDIYEADNISSMIGDTDDYLAFTIRAEGRSLVGQHLGNPIASTTAEVIWYTGFDDENLNRVWDPHEQVFLYRRQLLVMPELGQLDPTAYSDPDVAAAALRTYWQTSDVSASVRQNPVDSQFRIFANSLVDLTRREHRFAHQNLPQNFPNRLLFDNRWLPLPTDLNQDDPNSVTGTGLVSFSRYSYVGSGLGEDRILSNVLAFDVRVFDPAVPVLADNTNANTNSVGTLQPGDLGWNEAVANSYQPVGLGAYVDLGFNRYLPPAAPVNSQFSSAAAVHFGLPAATAATYRTALGYTYDTWAASYERDGIRQQTSLLPGVDPGTNGIDDDNNGLVDDLNERETLPPYLFPLRGLQVKIRVYEPGTRQMRQATIVADFIHE